MPEHRWRKKTRKKFFAWNIAVYYSFLFHYYRFFSFRWNINEILYGEKRARDVCISHDSVSCRRIYSLDTWNDTDQYLFETFDWNERKTNSIICLSGSAELCRAHFANNIDLIKFHLAEFLKHRLDELCPRTSSIAERWWILREDRNWIAYVEN